MAKIFYTQPTSLSEDATQAEWLVLDHRNLFLRFRYDLNPRYQNREDDGIAALQPNKKRKSLSSSLSIETLGRECNSTGLCIQFNKTKATSKT